MTFFVTPSASSISNVEGWIVAARCSIGGSGSCSNTVTEMPLRLSASAHTIPTGPAPTIATRAFAFDSAMPGRIVLFLQSERRHDAVPHGGILDEDFRELVRGRQQRLQTDVAEPLHEFRRLAPGDQRARQRV